jgi:predicted amidohydrolase YtcJ
VARRKPGTTIPNGVIEESVFFRVFAEMSQHMSYELIARSFVKFEQKYYSHGFTTVTDGRTDNISLISLIRFANEKRLKLDVVAYIDFIAFTQNDSFKNFSNYTSKYNYTNHMRIGGGKLAMDGSIQAFTAWMKEPYYHTPDGKSADYRGYPSFNSTEEVANLMTILRKNDMQINVHANGDAAVQRLIEAVEESRKAYKTTINIPSSEPFNFTNLDDERVVCVHCQVTSLDQTLRMKENNIIPSYFNAHTQFWGDFHKNESLGPERAKRLSVAGEAHNYGMLFTSHLDSPVVPPDAAYIISSLVNRKTASGVTLGE